MDNAENKAKQLASLAGVKLGKPAYISEGAVYQPPITRDFAESAAPVPVETPISPGELNITTHVQIAYAIA